MRSRPGREQGGSDYVTGACREGTEQKKPDIEGEPDILHTHTQNYKQC